VVAVVVVREVGSGISVFGLTFLRGDFLGLTFRLPVVWPAVRTSPRRAGG